MQSFFSMWTKRTCDQCNEKVVTVFFWRDYSFCSMKCRDIFRKMAGYGGDKPEDLIEEI